MLGRSSGNHMIGYLPTQALALLAVFVYATHATQAVAFEWKSGLSKSVITFMTHMYRMMGLYWCWKTFDDKFSRFDTATTATAR